MEEKTEQKKINSKTTKRRKQPLRNSSSQPEHLSKSKKGPSQPDYPPHPGYPPPGNQTPYPPPGYPPLPYPPPGYPPAYPPPGYYRQTIVKKISEIPIIWIFLIIISVYWLPVIFSGLVGFSFYGINPDLAEVMAGIFLCISTFLLMYFLRRRVDNPSWKEYGLTTENLGSNLKLAVKLIFIIFAVEFLVVAIIKLFGVSFKGGPQEIDIIFIISAVIVAPIFEETVYRMNASTLLARRFPIFWVAGITSVWFIAKHAPAWHIDDKFGLPAIFVIIILSSFTWWVVTYYYLKRNCIWIPIMIHVFNNGSIALFHLIPGIVSFLIEIVFIIIGIIFLFVFAIPKIDEAIIQPLKAGKIKFRKKTKYHLGMFAGLSLLFLLTSEMLVSVQYFNPLICFPIGLALMAISAFTVIYLFSQSEIVYKKD